MSGTNRSPIVFVLVVVEVVVALAFVIVEVVLFKSSTDPSCAAPSPAVATCERFDEPSTSVVDNLFFRPNDIPQLVAKLARVLVAIIAGREATNAAGCADVDADGCSTRIAVVTVGSANGDVRGVKGEAVRLLCAFWVFWVKLVIVSSPP